MSFSHTSLGKLHVFAAWTQQAAALHQTTGKPNQKILKPTFIP